MISFALKVQNANAIKFAFGDLATAVSDWRKYIWPGVRRYAIRPWLRKQFESEGRGAHGKWPQLSPNYAARKAILYPEEPILVASGRMKKDLLREKNEGETTARTMYYGTTVPYAIYHQTGTKFGKGKRRGQRKMPPRRIFDPEMSDGPGTMKIMIRVAVARGVSTYARRLGFALGATDPATAALLGRKSMLGGGAGEGPTMPVSEGI